MPTIRNSFPAIDAITYTAVADDATANYVEFIFPRKIVGAVGQVRASAGTENMTGFDMDITTGSGSSTVKVAVTDLAENDVIDLIVF